MKTRLAFIVPLLLIQCFDLAAHPSTGIVVDDRNDAYFIYWGGTWKLDGRAQLSRVDSSDFHFLALDTVGRFAAARIPDAVRITPGGSRPVLFSFPESPATFHFDGDLYAADLPAELPKPHIRSLAIDTNGDVYAAAIGCRATLRITPAGAQTTVLRAESPWSPSGVAIAAEGLYVMEYDNALTEYPVDGRPRIRKVTRDGAVTTVAVMEKGTRGPSRP